MRQEIEKSKTKLLKLENEIFATKPNVPKFDPRAQICLVHSSIFELGKFKYFVVFVIAVCICIN